MKCHKYFPTQETVQRIVVQLGVTLDLFKQSQVQVLSIRLQQTRLATEKQNCDCLFVVFVIHRLSTSGVLLSFTGGNL